MLIAKVDLWENTTLVKAGEPLQLEYSEEEKKSLIEQGQAEEKT